MTASMTKYASGLSQPVVGTSQEVRLIPQPSSRTNSQTICIFAQPLKAPSKGSAALAKLINKIESTSEGKAAMSEARTWAGQNLYGDERTLASIRMSIGLSQKQLAEDCGMEQPHMSRYESGKSEPGVIVAKKIADKLKISLDDFLHAFEASKKRTENAYNN